MIVEARVPSRLPRGLLRLPRTLSRTSREASRPRAPFRLAWVRTSWPWAPPRPRPAFWSRLADDRAAIGLKLVLVLTLLLAAALLEVPY